MTKLLDLIAQPINVAGGPVRVSASIGLVFYPQDGTDAKGLFDVADSRMYAAKNRGHDVRVGRDAPSHTSGCR